MDPNTNRTSRTPQDPHFTNRYEVFHKKEIVRLAANDDFNAYNKEAYVNDNNDALGVVDGYVADTKTGEPRYVIVRLHDETRQTPGKPHLLFPAEEVRNDDGEVRISVPYPEHLASYPVYQPGDVITREMELEIRKRYTSGYTGDREDFEGEGTTLRRSPAQHSEYRIHEES